MRWIWIGFLCSALAVAETDEMALEWLHKAQEKAGGAEKLADIEDVLLKRHMRSLAAGMTAEQTVRYLVPEALRQESALPFGRMTIYIDAQGGWMHGPQGLMDMPPPQLRQARGELFRLREALLLADRLGDRTVRFLREAEDDGRGAAVLEVASADGAETAEVWINRETGEFYKIAYQGVALAGQPPRVEEIYADFRQVDGIRVPHKTSIRQNGTPLTDVTVVEAAVNTGADVKQLAARP